MRLELFTSLFNDGETKAQGGDVIDSVHSAWKHLPWQAAVTCRAWPFSWLPFPWTVDSGRERGGGLGLARAQPWASWPTLLPRPGQAPLGSPSQAPCRLLGSVMQEADPAVWTINSSRSGWQEAASPGT